MLIKLQPDLFIMVAWSDLGHCNSVACDMKGSCGHFFPADLQIITHANAFGLKCVCGCFGNQHYAARTDHSGSNKVSFSCTINSLQQLEIPIQVNEAFPPNLDAVPPDNPSSTHEFRYTRPPNQSGGNTMQAPRPSTSGTSAYGNTEMPSQTAPAPARPPPPFFPLNEAAKLRKEHQQAELGRAFGRNMFDPAWQ